LLEIDDDLSPNHRNIVKKIMDRVREPRNYGLTPEEQEIAKRNEIAEKEKREREEREERERNEEEAANDRAKKQKEWTTKLEQIKREEFQMLDAQSTPLRNYLMTHVMPTLTKALIGKISSLEDWLTSVPFLVECCQVRPDDPVDFVVSTAL
jgi:adenylate kinase